MANLIPRKQIEDQLDFSGSVNITDDLTVSGSIFVSGGLILNGEFESDDISIFESTIEFTNGDAVVGIITASNDGLIINGTLFGDTFISGNFTGLGDNIFFTRVGTNIPTESVMLIGNYYEDDLVDEYNFKQTTIFKNGNIIVSGSIEIAEDGYLLLNELTTPPPVNGDKGGLYYSTDGFYYLLSAI
jgi:hypothetical protein